MDITLNMLGEYGITALSVLATLAATMGLARLVHTFTAQLDKKLEKTLEKTPKPHVEVPDFKIDATHYRFFKHFITGLIYFGGCCLALSMIPAFKSLAYSVFAGSGILLGIITFASREAFTNVLGGLLIDIFRPFEIGNHIKIDKDLEGDVKDITLSHTIIKTAQQNYVMVPNSVINSKMIENVTLPKEEISIPFDVYISYKADIDKALETVRNVLELHPLLLDKRTKEEKEQGKTMVQVNVEKLDHKDIQLRAWVSAKNEADAYRLACDSYREVKKSFDAKRIPFPEAKSTSKELSL